MGAHNNHYSAAFTRIRDAVAALPVDSAVLDGEAIVLRVVIRILETRREDVQALSLGRAAGTYAGRAGAR